MGRNFIEGISKPLVLQIKDPLQADSKTCKKHSALNNNICLIWFQNLKKITSFKILKMTFTPYSTLKNPESMNIQIFFILELLLEKFVPYFTEKSILCVCPSNLRNHVVCTCLKFRFNLSTPFFPQCRTLHIYHAVQLKSDV